MFPSDPGATLSPEPQAECRRSARSAWQNSALEIMAVLGLALVCIFLLYGPRWLNGQTIFRGVIQEQYYLLGQYAFDRQIVTEFGEGCFPLWNPMNGLGTPLLGNMLSGAFYPLKIMVYLWTSDGARDLYIVLRLVLAALFAFALAKQLRLAFLPAALAALCFAFTGYMKMFVNENYLNADVLLPAAALLALRLREGPKLRDVALLGLVTFAVINNGHPEAAFYTLLLPAFLVIATASRKKPLGRAVLLFCGAISLGVLLSLPMLLPFLEYWFRGWHFHVPGAGFFHYSARQAAALVTPWFFGKLPAGAPFLTPPRIVWPETSPGMPAYAASNVPWLVPAIGAVPLLLAMMAVSRPRGISRIDAALLIYAVFFLGVMFGLPLFRLIGFIPVFSFSGNFKHPEPGVALAFALLAGRGLHMIFTGRVSGTRAANVVLILFVAVLLMGVVYDPLPNGPSFINKQSGSALLVIVVTGTWLAWCARGLNGKKLSPDMRAFFASLTGIICLAAAMATLVMDGFIQPTRDPGYEKKMEAGDALARLRERASLSRVYVSQDISPPNLNILFGLADIRVMDGVNDRRLVEAVNKINGHDRARAGTYWYREVGYLQPMPDKLASPMLQVFDVAYALMDGPLPYNRTIGRVMNRAFVLAPGANYVGRARFPVSHGSAPGLFQHPPSKIVWEPVLPQTEMEARPSRSGHLLLHFRPALIQSAAAKEPDGVWFGMIHENSLVYARYLFPRGVPADADLDFAGMGLDCINDNCGELILSTLPGASGDYDQAGWTDLRAGPAEAFDPGPWEELARGETWLYYNPSALPRVFLASGVETAGKSQALDDLAMGLADPRETVILEEGVAGAVPGFPEEGSGLPGVVSAIDYSSQRLGVEARMWEAGRLVIADLYYPGWRVFVDGKEEKIERADYCLRSVALAAGVHSITVLYEPASFRLGLWVMMGAAVSLVMFPLLTRRVSPARDAA